MKRVLTASAVSMLATVATAQERAPDARLDAVSVTGNRSSLVVPDTAQATTTIERIPGGVEVVPDTAFKDGPSAGIKDILAYVPGVVTQPRFGPDAKERRTALKESLLLAEAV